MTVRNHSCHLAKRHVITMVNAARLNRRGKKDPESRIREGQANGGGAGTLDLVATNVAPTSVSQPTTDVSAQYCNASTRERATRFPRARHLKYPRFVDTIIVALSLTRHSEVRESSRRGRTTNFKWERFSFGLRL